MVDIYLTEAVDPFHVSARSVNTFTTKQDVTPSPIPTIKAGKLRPGSMLYMKAVGDVSTTGTPTLALGFYFGTRAGVITGDIAVTAAQTMASGAAAFPWWIEWEGRCTGVGSAGSLLGQGQAQFGSSLTAFSAEVPFPVTASARTVTMNTIVEQSIGVSAAFSASSASNQVTVNSLRVVIFN